jgi:molybdopterin molybdotransferase
MITVEKALQIVLDHTHLLEPVEVPILKGTGMVLAEEIVATEDIPAFDMATVEGYALRTADICGADRGKPVFLALDGEIMVGGCWDSIVKPGHALKVAAGSALPEGVDTVVSAEYAVRETSRKVRIYKAQKPGDHIFARGGDVEAGSLIFQPGRILGAADIGVLSALGRNAILCFRHPKVSFFSSGNDLVQPDEPPQSGRLRPGTPCTIRTCLSGYGAEPVDLGIFRVDSEQIKDRLERARESDLLIASVGSSFSDFDTMKGILQKMGLDLKFWRVAVRPGKPIIFGMLDSLPVFGILGNILSSMIVLEQFIRPALLKMQGRREVRRTEIVARLGKDVNGGGGVTHFVRAEVKVTDDGFLVIPSGSRNSSSLRAFCSANGFIVMPPEVDYIRAGELVRVQIISDLSSLN